MLLETLLLLLIAASWLFWLVALWAVWTLLRSQPEGDPTFSPPVSILKPVRGLDAGAYENFASFCQQNYPDFELLFGIADPEDPAVAVIQRLQRDFRGCTIRLVIGPAFGANRKASLLHHLSTQACHEVLVISDSDMRVTPEYLRRVVAPLANRHVGLVTCPYWGKHALSLAARLEALYMGVTFLPSLAVASRLFHIPGAVGATVALRSKDLAKLGGFAAIADYLADDYELGARVASLGLRVLLSSYVVDSILGSTTFGQQWHRELRWARCTRVSRPREYPGLLLTFSTPLALCLLLISGLAPPAWQALAVSLSLRWLVAWGVIRCVGDQEARRWLIWLPLRDVLSALVWLVAGLGRHITWREERFVLYRDGRMQPLPQSAGRRWAGIRVWRF